MLLIILLGSIALWVACARYGYRCLVRREAFRQFTYGGGKPTSCVDYMKSFHSSSRCCAKCADWTREEFTAEKHARLTAALALGPLLFTGLCIAGIVAGKQPLSRSEQAHRLAQAEEELSKANAELDRLREQ